MTVKMTPADVTDLVRWYSVGATPSIAEVPDGVHQTMSSSVAVEGQDVKRLGHLTA